MATVQARRPPAAVLVVVMAALTGCWRGVEGGGDPVDGGADSDTDTLTDGSGDTDSAVVDCAGHDNFVLCTVDTTELPNGDFTYDICADELCTSPGSCDDASCNVPGPHLALPPAVPAGPVGEGYTRVEGASGEWLTTDDATGLMWQGCRAGLTGASCVGEDPGADDSYVWGAALAYCDDLEWGGHDDWRLPDEWELHSIVDYGAWAPAIDASAFPQTPTDSFWTSSSDASNPTRAWCVSFDNGEVSNQDKLESLRARCVRTAPSPQPPDRFARSEAAAGEWVVTDQFTGLVWQGCPGGLSGAECEVGGTTTINWYLASGTPHEIYNPDGAFDHCGDLDWGGHDDWRLPDIRELYSLVDNRKEIWLKIDTAAFPGTQTFGYWSASAHAGTSSLAWSVKFVDASVIPAAKVEGGGRDVYCVRQGS